MCVIWTTTIFKYFSFFILYYFCQHYAIHLSWIDLLDFFINITYNIVNVVNGLTVALNSTHVVFHSSISTPYAIV